MQKTNSLVIELFKSLEDGVSKGTLEGNILMFRNIKRAENYVYPLIESKKIIDKMLADYNKEMLNLYREYNAELIDNNFVIPRFIKKEDGTYDTSKLDPKFLEFKAKEEKLVLDNKELVVKHQEEESKYNELLDKVIDPKTLNNFNFVEIPQKLIPKKANGDADINCYPLLEFGIIPIEEEKEEKKKKVKN